jgi:hypothetical protein
LRLPPSERGRNVSFCVNTQTGIHVAQFIIDTLRESTIPYGEAMQDLADALRDPDIETAFDEILQAWREMTTGIVSPEDTVSLADDGDDVPPMTLLNERQSAAMRLAKERGVVVAGDLRELFPDLTAETIRQDLATLVDVGALVRQGEKRGTTYTLPTLVRLVADEAISQPAGGTVARNAEGGGDLQYRAG